MPDARTRRLDQLMAEGLTVYPSGMSAAPPPSWDSGIGQVPIRYQRIQSGTVWGGLNGLGQSRQERAAKKFLGWLKRKNPQLYKAAMRRANVAQKNAATLGQEDVPWWQKAIDAAGSLATQYATYEQENKIMDIQIARAEAGLDPLETGEFSTVERAASAAGASAARTAVGALTQSPIMWIAAGGLALIAFTSMRGPRRRRR